MKLKTSSIFSLIFFGAIPLVIFVIFLEVFLSVGSNDQSNPFSFSGAVSKPKIISAKRYSLEDESKGIRPLKIDYIRDDLYIFTVNSVHKFELKKDAETNLQFKENKSDEIISRYQFIFDLNDKSIGIKQNTSTEDNSIPTNIEIQNTTTKEILYALPNPIDPATSAVFSLSNRTLVSDDNKYIALVFENLDDSDSYKLVKVWDLNEGSTARELELNTYQNFKFTKDSNFLAINYSDEKPIYFYNLKDLTKDFKNDYGSFIDQYEFIGNKNEILTLAYFDPNLDFRAFEREVDRPIQVIRDWKISDKSKINEVYISNSKVLKVFESKNPDVFVLVRQNGVIDFLSLKENKIIKSFDSGVELKNLSQNRIQISSDKTQLIFYDRQDYIQIINFSTDVEDKCNRFSFSVDGFRCLFRIQN